MLVGQGEILTQLEGQLFPNTGPGYAEAISQEKKVLLAEVMVIKEEKNILFGEKMVIVIIILIVQEWKLRHKMVYMV